MLISFLNLCERRPGAHDAILALVQEMIVGTLAANIFVTSHSRTKRRALNLNIVMIFLMAPKFGVRLVCRYCGSCCKCRCTWEGYCGDSYIFL